ncbi:MAG: ABC transporter permease [Phycisphaerales bacterium]|nr:MAG: ABC transporter permease [Phycisphaerales bacterium]
MCRVRQFYREPEAVFWTYVFPLIMIVGLGIAFRNRPAERIAVDVVKSDGSADAMAALSPPVADGFDVEVRRRIDCRERLRLGKTSIVVDVTDEGYVYRYDPTRPESVSARARVDDALQRAAGRTDPVAASDHLVMEPGSRYIDFLVPGLLGMNLMGGGLWGIGYVTVDMRVRKLLKRLVASPMRRSDFLLSLVGGRLIFTVPEVAVVLGAGVLLFDIMITGRVASVMAVALLGACSFSGIGLLVACRARRLETVTGLMNVIMLPMWLLSGIFFSYERFPAWLHPFIKALPLTQLNDALRAVILEGESLPSQWFALLYLTVMGTGCFCLALRWFRWN